MSSLVPIGAFAVLGVAAVAAAAYAIRRSSRDGGGTYTLSRVTHLVPDASGTWMHVFGARRLMPEHGESSDVWYHLMVEPRSGRWVAGASAPGPDLDLKSPFVTRSMEELSVALGFEPALRRGQKLALRVREPGDDAETLSPSARPALVDGLLIAPAPEREARVTQACTATLVANGQPLGTHTFDAIAGAGFVTRSLDPARVAFFSYVAMSFGDVAAHLVAIDLDSGALIFDVPCRYTRPSSR